MALATIAHSNSAMLHVVQQPVDNPNRRGMTPFNDHHQISVQITRGDDGATCQTTNKLSKPK